MIFVTACNCRVQLAKLTQLLLSAFPGSTIYQHTELCHVPHDVLNNKVDAVLLDAELDRTNGLNFVKMLRRQKIYVPVFVIAKAGEFREAAMDAGADGYCVLPGSEKQLLDAIQLAQVRRSAPCPCAGSDF